MDSMSTTYRLFVEGLVGETKPADLKSTFGQFGEVTEVQAIAHKGFGYVTLTKTDESRVKKCIFALNSTKWRGNKLRLEVAKPEFQQRLAERQKEDIELEKERLATKLAKIERRNKATILPPPRYTKSATEEGDNFVPSYPHGWALVRGRYLPIVRLGRKGREGGIVVDPKAHASSKQNILCHVKPLRVEKILTSLPPDTQRIDEAHKAERKLEVDRWARGLFRQRSAAGNPIQSLEEYLKDHSELEDEQLSAKKRSKRENDDSDFEVVEADEDHNGFFEVGSNASFSDIEELMDRANGKKTKKQKETPSTASKAKTTSSSASKAVNSKAGMLSVIDSILSAKQGSDYGDSDSEDFEMHPTSGESSDAEPAPRKPARVIDSDDSDLNDASSDAEYSSDSDISANSFHNDDEEVDGGVVDFSSDDENGEMVDASESDDDEEIKSDEKESPIVESESESDSFEGEYDDVSSSSSVSSAPPAKEKSTKAKSAKKQLSALSSSSEASDKESDDESDSNLSEDSDMEVDQPKSSVKKVEIDDEDDINLHIFTSAPKSKSTPKSASSMDVDVVNDSDSSEDEKVKAKKGKKRVWSADTQEANKKYAYSELVREEDEKIFAMMRDTPESAPKESFRFLSNRASSSVSVPTSAPSAGFTFLNRGRPSASTITTESASLLSALESRIASQASSSSTSFKPSGTNNPSAQGSLDAVTVPKVTSEQKAKMFLFSMGRSPATSPSGASPSPNATPTSPASSFVRGTQVDKIQRMWSGTKDAQRQQAQRNHKLASKRVKAKAKF